MEGTDTERNPQTCSKTWCHRELPTNYRWKTCDHCRECDRKTKRTQRASDKVKKEAATLKQAGDKRKRVPDSSDTSKDEQPTHHRKENAASGMDMDFLDDEDDEDLSSDKEEVCQVHKRGKMIQKLM